MQDHPDFVLPSQSVPASMMVGMNPTGDVGGRKKPEGVDGMMLTRNPEFRPSPSSLIPSPTPLLTFACNSIKTHPYIGVKNARRERRLSRTSCTAAKHCQRNEETPQNSMPSVKIRRRPALSRCFRLTSAC